MKKKIISRVIIIILLCLIGLAVGLLYFGIIHINNPSKTKYPIRGVDVSSHQGTIDWEEIASQDIDFAYIKATEGSGYLDSYFDDNWENAADAGLYVGAYHFFSFESSGEKQAENFIDNVKPHGKMLPPVIDVEFYGEFNSVKDIDVDDVQEELRSMVDALEKAYDQKPIIYTTKRAYNSILEDEFDDCDLWFRSVYTPVMGDVDWTFWQYSNRTHLKGYDGHEKYIDMNVFCGDKKDFKKLVKEYDEDVEEEEEQPLVDWNYFEEQMSKSDVADFEEFMPILNDEETFYCFDWNDEDVTFSEYLESIECDDTPDIHGIALVDIDGQNGKELILDIYEGGGNFLILTRDNNEFFGTSRGTRTFEMLQNDGKFLGSGGVSDAYYYTMSIDKNGVKETLIGELHGEDFTLVDGEAEDWEKWFDENYGDEAHWILGQEYQSENQSECYEVYVGLKNNALYTEAVQENYDDLDYQGLLYSFEVDLDCDGENEAFVVDGEESGYDDGMWTAYQMWFVDEKRNCQKLDDLFSMGSVDIYMGQYGKTIDDNTYFIINGQVGAEGLGCVYTVMNDKLVVSSASIPSFGQKGFVDDDLVWYKEFYGMSMDNVDGKPDVDMAMGRCYVPYHLGLKDGKFELYSATELSEDDIKEYECIKKDNYKDAVAVQYILRDNNELDINYVTDDGEQFNFNADCYYVSEDKTAEYQNTIEGYYSLQPIDNSGWDFLD